MTSLKMWHAEYPETQSVGIIELSEKEQWLGPIGKRVNVGFHCLACGKTFKTHGNGNRSWKQEQLPGAHAAWTHSKGARHVQFVVAKKGFFVKQSNQLLSMLC